MSVIGFWLAARYEGGETRNDARGWRALGDAMQGINLIRRMATHPPRFAPALLGVAVYWGGEVLSLWGAVRAFDAAIALGPLIVGLATGYALTRRSMPFAGAGITEALLSFALLWVGLDLASAVAATILYRLFSFIVPMAPGLWARREVIDLIHPELATETAPGATAGERPSSSA
jgi:uncharacterized membrane protein YbhN (UPF0104 family)